MSKNVLAVHDISCIGRCSLTVALPILSYFGVETRLLPTALLSTHTGGFTNFSYLDLTSEMEKIMSAWQPLDLQFDAIYSGFMATGEQIGVLKKMIQTYKTEENKIVIDPVMADNGQLYQVFDDAFVERMAELVPFADVLTPNVTEACLLTKTPYQDDQHDSEFIATLLSKLLDQGAKAVVLTGIKTQKGKIGVAVSSDSEYRQKQNKVDFQTYLAEEFPGTFHGTGDIFGSVLTAQLLKSDNLFESAKVAVDFVWETIKATPIDADRRFGVDFEQVLDSKKF